jgi:hypothetical protein
MAQCAAIECLLHCIRHIIEQVIAEADVDVLAVGSNPQSPFLPARIEIDI